MQALKLSDADKTIRENRNEFYSAMREYVLDDDCEMSKIALCTALNMIVKGRYLGRSRELSRAVCFTAAAVVYAMYVELQHGDPAIITLDDDEPTDEQLNEIESIPEVEGMKVTRVTLEDGTTALAQKPVEQDEEVADQEDSIPE